MLIRYHAIAQKKIIETLDLPANMSEHERDEARRQIGIEHNIPSTYIRLYAVKEIPE